MSLAANLARRTTLTACRRPAAPSSRPTGAFRPHQACRQFGASGQPESQSMRARLWEGHPQQPEGWETTLYTTYIVGSGLLILALGFAPDTTIATWANNEAQARLDLQVAGKLEQPTFGVHYNTPEGTGAAQEWDTFMTKAIKPGEDDDDDDDDEDDEEEEEDDDDDE